MYAEREITRPAKRNISKRKERAQANVEEAQFDVQDKRVLSESDQLIRISKYIE